MPEVQLANTGENPGAYASEHTGSQPLLYVHLAISDPEVLLAAREYPEGFSRPDLFPVALKITVFSLPAAQPDKSKTKPFLAVDSVVDTVWNQLNGFEYILQPRRNMPHWCQEVHRERDPREARK